jgi:hypothetical protein
MGAIKVETPSDLGLTVIEVDGSLLFTREYATGFEQVWVETPHASEYAIAYNGRFYMERS